MLDGRMLVRWLVLLVLAFSFAGCGRTVSPAELRAFEARSYHGHPKAKVYNATIVALKSQGYEIVATDAAAGRIKTGPKLVVVHAARTSSSSAIASGDSVAWTIDVASSSDGTELHAEPRLYSAGQSVETTRLNYDYAQRLFSTLYREIEDNLPGRATTTAAR
jgi:hypothetical protein